MDVVEEYLKNLKRFDDAEKYFESLSEEQLSDMRVRRAYESTML